MISVGAVTWDGNNRDCLIGHHPGRIAVFHVEMGGLEAAPGIEAERRNDIRLSIVFVERVSTVKPFEDSLTETWPPA